MKLLLPVLLILSFSAHASLKANYKNQLDSSYINMKMGIETGLISGKFPNSLKPVMNEILEDVKDQVESMKKLVDSTSEKTLTEFENDANKSKTFSNRLEKHLSSGFGEERIKLLFKGKSLHSKEKVKKFLAMDKSSLNMAPMIRETYKSALGPMVKMVRETGLELDLDNICNQIVTEAYSLATKEELKALQMENLSRETKNFKNKYTQETIKLVKISSRIMQEITKHVDKERQKFDMRLPESVKKHKKKSI